MSEATAEFPLPNDATDEERTAALDAIAKHTTIRAEDGQTIRFDGRLIGQTGPIWRMQYTRMYELAEGYLAIGHELRRGIVGGFAQDVAGLPDCFDHPGVREFIQDELRFRGVLKAEAAS